MRVDVWNWSVRNPTDEMMRRGLKSWRVVTSGEMAGDGCHSILADGNRQKLGRD